MKQVNIKALAQELGLSVSTISKALRDSHEISEKTKQRVLELAAELNYMPNPYASSLRGKKSRNIAVVIPEVADSFFSLAINGIESVVKDRGYHVLICLTHEDFQNEQAILKEFRSGRVDGVLISVASETGSGTHIRELLSREIPVVYFDRVLKDLPLASVVTDDAAAGYNATQHLISNGCRRIAFLGLSPNLSISNDRLSGYVQALTAAGLPLRKSDIAYCAATPQQNYNTVKKMLQRQQRPDGIVACAEKLTTVMYQVCRDLALRIPEDVKVLCFSNQEMAAMLSPSLTTITQPAFEMGKAAAEILLKLLDKKPVTATDRQLVIPSVLVKRASTGG